MVGLSCAEIGLSLSWRNVKLWLFFVRATCLVCLLADPNGPRTTYELCTAVYHHAACMYALGNRLLQGTEVHTAPFVYYEALEALIQCLSSHAPLITNPPCKPGLPQTQTN